MKIRETELRNIITIIEGLRYALEPQEIRKYLIGFEEEKEVVR